MVDPGTFVVQTLNGLQYGFVLFLIASGLTVILGILDVLNLAHGELYAFGAYASVGAFGYAVGLLPAPSGPVGGAIFAVGIVVAAIAAALVMVPLGVVFETVFLRPIYERDQVYQLVLTFALLLVILDLKAMIWGLGNIRTDGPYSGVNEIPVASQVGLNFPTYNLLLIGVGMLMVGLLFWFFERSKTGRIIRATAIDREMATAIGVSPDRTFTLVFALGAFLAGFAGAMHVPSTAASLDMGTTPLVLSFVVIVIGGLGSLKGAFVGAILVGVIRAWMTWQFPALEIAAPFAIMALILLVKPEGLFGTWGEVE